MSALTFLLLLESGALYDDYDRVREEVTNEWMSGQRNQSWRLVPKAKLVRLYNENGKYGRINEGILTDILMTVQECALKIIINSETHFNDKWPYGDEPELYEPVKTQSIPGQPEFALDDPRDTTPNEMPEEKVEKIRERAWDRWFLFVSDLSNNQWVRNFGEVKGNARYSDGSRTLMRYLEATYSAKTPEEQLMALDRVLNFVHGLGAMAKWFVEGGVTTLNQIANFAPQGMTAAGLR